MVWSKPLSNMRYECHFGDRMVRCFAERPSNVAQVFLDAVAKNPTGEALVANDYRCNYQQLNDQVERLAAGLAAAGLEQGERIAILLGNRPEFLWVLLAAIRLGAIAVPLNIREQTAELEYVLNNCAAKMIVHEADLSERLPNAEQLPKLEKRYAVGEGVTASEQFTDLLMETAMLSPPTVEIGQEDVAVILYTSGTTGRPKGAMLTHFNIVHSLLHFEHCMGLAQHDRAVLAVPASHVTGTVAILLAMVNVAGCTVLMETFKASAFLQLAERERLTTTILVPAMYNLCLLEPDFEQFDLTAWRIGGYGGAPMPEATIEKLADKLPNMVLMNAYGSTETTSPTTLMPPGHTAGRSDSVGRVLPCAEVRIMDEQGCEVPAGESGEIWIKGAMVVPGYWDNPEATAAGFAAGYWCSGDIGALDEEGYLRVFDRKKDMINRGGYKIYSAELENVLSYHPDVIECAAVARPDEVLGEKVQIFVRCHEGKGDAKDLQAFCAARLSDYKVPEFINFINEPLPRNANGKIVKTSLRDTV